MTSELHPKTIQKMKECFKLTEERKGIVQGKTWKAREASSAVYLQAAATSTPSHVTPKNLKLDANKDSMNKTQELAPPKVDQKQILHKTNIVEAKHKGTKESVPIKRKLEGSILSTQSQQSDGIDENDSPKVKKIKKKTLNLEAPITKKKKTLQSELWKNETGEKFASLGIYLSPEPSNQCKVKKTKKNESKDLNLKALETKNKQDRKRAEFSKGNKNGLDSPKSQPLKTFETAEQQSEVLKNQNNIPKVKKSKNRINSLNLEASKTGQKTNKLAKTNKKTLQNEFKEIGMGSSNWESSRINLSPEPAHFKLSNQMDKSFLCNPHIFSVTEPIEDVVKPQLHFADESIASNFSDKNWEIDTTATTLKIPVFESYFAEQNRDNKSKSDASFPSSDFSQISSPIENYNFSDEEDISSSNISKSGTSLMSLNTSGTPSSNECSDDEDTSSLSYMSLDVSPIEHYNSSNEEDLSSSNISKSNTSLESNETQSPSENFERAGADAHIIEATRSFSEQFSIFENSVEDNKVLAVLKNKNEFYGTVTVTLLCGQIEINGYKPRKFESVTIYSPKGFSWVTITPATRAELLKEDDLNEKELNNIFSRAQLNNIVSNYDNKKDAIVLLQRNTSAQKIVNTFAKHMSENVFPQTHTLPTNRPLYVSEYLLGCLIQSADKTASLGLLPSWAKITLEKTSRLMITGGKSVGKSTMLRYLINGHLSRYPAMLLIDLDIGQPELFVSHTVSCSVVDGPLLGPGFFLNKQPDKAYVVGHVNVVMCAEQYVRAVQQLLEFCRKNSSYAGMPWLINTMGYNKGFGLELMSLLVSYVKPTNVVQILSNKDINNFDKLLHSKSLSEVQRVVYSEAEFKTEVLSEYTLHPVKSAVQHNIYKKVCWTMSPKEVRYANLLARLSAAFKGSAEWLTDCQPLQVPLDELQIQHLTMAEYTRDELIAGMEANIVFLCHQRTGADKLLPECLGIGVVRAIDYEAKKLYLIPAMPLARMSKVNLLVLGGDLTLPQGYFKDQGPGVANNVPFVFILDDDKSSKSIKQIYFRTAEFLGNGKHKT